MSRTMIAKLVEDKNGTITMAENITYRIDEILEEKEPITKKDLETLGYACGEIKKSIEKGFNKSLNNEPLEDDDKDIPLIPDDELYEISNSCTKDIYGFSKSGCDRDTALNYNFKVLKEKINQVVEEFNEYRKENE